MNWQRIASVVLATCLLSAIPELTSAFTDSAVFAPAALQADEPKPPADKKRDKSPSVPPAAKAGAPAGAVPQYVKTKRQSAVALRDAGRTTIKQLLIADDPSIELLNCQDVTIASCELRSIKLTGCKRVRIINCWIHDSPSCGVVLDGCQDVLVQGNRMERVSSGVYAHQGGGIQVLGNYVEDVQGPMPRGQMTQFNQVSGGKNAICRNFALNHVQQSKPEDMISLFCSRGLAGDPIRIEDNYLTGDPERGSQDKSGSGSGIMLGDGGGEHLLCQRNIVINAGQAGIGVAGGSNINVSENIVIGAKSNVSNVGIYVWNQSKEPGGEVVVKKNHVMWSNSKGDWNSWWVGGGFSEIKADENTFNDPELMKMLPEPPNAQGTPPLPFGPKPTVPWKTKAK